MNREKTLEAVLVITIGFLIIYLIKGNHLFLYVSVSVGLVGIFIKPLAKLIAKFWFKLGDWLGWIVSKLVLGVIFYSIVFPVAALYKLFNKDPLKIKANKDSLWTERNHKYTPGDLKNSW
jgi:polyferredoxin